MHKNNLNYVTTYLHNCKYFLTSFLPENSDKIRQIHTAPYLIKFKSSKIQKYFVAFIQCIPCVSKDRHHSPHSFLFIYKTYQVPVLVHRYQSTVLQVKAGSETKVVVSTASITIAANSYRTVVSNVEIIATTKSANGTC